MLISKSNVWSLWLATIIFAGTLIVCSAASAQIGGGGGTGGGGTGGGGTGGGGGGAGGGGGGQQGAGQQAGGAGILDPATAFAGEVPREAGVGQFTEPVGASVNSAAASLSTTGARSGGGFSGGGLGGLGGLGAAFSNNLTTGAAGGSEAAAPLRTRLRSGVILPPASIESQITQEINVNNRLQRTSTLGPRSRNNGQYFPGDSNGATDRPLYGVNVQMQGRTAILQGTVSTVADRRMSELLIRLEPGVSQVENRINVAD